MTSLGPSSKLGVGGGEGGGRQTDVFVSLLCEPETQWLLLCPVVPCPGHSDPLASGPCRQGAAALCPARSEGDPAAERRAAAAECVRGPLPPAPSLAWLQGLLRPGPGVEQLSLVRPEAVSVPTLGRGLVLTGLPAAEAALSWPCAGHGGGGTTLLNTLKNRLKDLT